MLASLPARAQEAYPARPVRIIVPYAAGGPLDGMVRLISDRLSKRIGQPVLVDNRAGASGIIGAEATAKSAPDGYTMMISVMDTQINNAALFRNLSYDPLKDFVQVTQIASAPTIMVANADIPANTLREFVAYARANKGKLSYGSWAAGGTGHIMTEVFNRSQGLDMVHAPYKGEGPMVQDLLAKSIALGMASIANAKQHVEKGSLKAYAVSGSARSAAVPDVPTLAELGFTDPIYQVKIWFGAHMPARTLASISQKMQAEIKAVLELPEVANVLNGRAFSPSGMAGEEFDRVFRSDYAVLTRLIKDLGIEIVQ